MKVVALGKGARAQKSFRGLEPRNPNNLELSPFLDQSNVGSWGKGHSKRH